MAGSQILPQWWMQQSYQQQIKYLQEHPNSRLRKSAAQTFAKLEPKQKTAVTNFITSVAEKKVLAKQFDKHMALPATQKKLRPHRSRIARKLRVAIRSKSLAHFIAAASLTLLKVGFVAVAGTAMVSAGVPLVLLTPDLLLKTSKWAFAAYLKQYEIDKKNGKDRSEEEDLDALTETMSKALRKVSRKQVAKSLHISPPKKTGKKKAGTKS